MSVEDVTVLVDYTVRKFCIQQVQFSAPFQAFEKDLLTVKRWGGLGVRNCTVYNLCGS